MPLDQNLLHYLDDLGNCDRAFNQGAGWKELPESVKEKYPAAGDDSPSEGYCRGACIDWIRDVLLRPGKPLTSGHHNKRRVERMVAVWSEPYAAERAHAKELNRQFGDALFAGHQQTTRGLFEEYKLRWGAFPP